MARAKKTRRRDNPEAQMRLGAHLKELRNRFFIALIFIVLGAVGGFFLYQPVVTLLIEPVLAVGEADPSRRVEVVYDSVGMPLEMMIRVSLFLGLVISAPFWLYQVWAFIMPALRKNEKRYTVGFLAAAVPLFLAGIGLGYWILPQAVRMFLTFNVDQTSNLVNANSYLTFVLNLLLAFGIAMILPVLLVGLNMMGIITAKQIIKHWRITVFLIALISALAAPGSDIFTMFYLAIPLVLLFGVATGLAALNDRRRAKRLAAQAGEDGAALDAATPLDELP